MQNNAQRDSQIITLENSQVVQADMLTALTTNANRALFEAYTALQEGRVEDLETGLIAAHAAVGELQKFGEAGIAVIAGLGEVAREFTEKYRSAALENEGLKQDKNRLADQLDELQETFEERLIDRTEYLAQAEDECRVEEIAEEIAFGSGLEIAAAQERQAAEDRIKRAQKIADELMGELDHDYDNEPDEDEDEYESEFGLTDDSLLYPVDDEDEDDSDDE
jgi:hypothetical protein